MFKSHRFFSKKKIELPVLYFYFYHYGAHDPCVPVGLAVHAQQTCVRLLLSSAWPGQCKIAKSSGPYANTKALYIANTSISTFLMQTDLKVKADFATPDSI